MPLIIQYSANLIMTMLPVQGQKPPHHLTVELPVTDTYVEGDGMIRSAMFTITLTIFLSFPASNFTGGT
jgi:hypothetical protein